MSQQIAEAKSLKDVVEVFGSEEAVVTFIKKAVAFKEQQRLSHKKNYLRNQMILQRAKEQGITADDEI